MKKTLIVVDMQNDFIDMALGTKEAVAIVPKVLKKIQQYAAREIVAGSNPANLSKHESSEPDFKGRIFTFACVKILVNPTGLTAFLPCTAKNPPL